MRIFLVQNVKGLWPSSGEWRANVYFLKYLASKGHATAQMCYATQEELAGYFAEAERQSWKLNAQKSLLQFSQGNDRTLQVPVTTFLTMDRINTIVVENEAFQKHYPSNALDADVKDYIEVGIHSMFSTSF
jgi:hypothetical protein